MTDNDHVRRLRSAGVALRDRGRYADALARFTEALALDPDDAGTWNNVQFCRARLGDRAGSLQAADELVRLRPEWARGHYCRAFSLSRLRRYDEAVAAAREAVRLAPDDPDMWRCLAQHLRLAGEPDQARAAASRACELGPTEVVAWVELGRTARHAADYPTAHRALRRALELDPLDTDAHCELVLVLNTQRRHEEAAAHARSALSLDWSHDRGAMPTLVGELANSLAAGGLVDEAGELLRTAIAARPDSTSLRNELVDIFRCAGDTARAVAAAREGVAALPDEADAWCSLALVLDYSDAEALAAARRATDLDPSSSWAWYLYGNCLRASGELSAAVAAFHRCAQARPGLEMEQSRVSQNLSELGDPAAGLTYAERGVALSPYAARPRRRRAFALLGLGRTVEALDTARTATDLAPEDPLNWVLRAEIAFYAGDADDARTSAEHAAIAAAGRGDDRDAAHHAAEARAFAAWAQGDLAAARAAFVEASLQHDTCCCTRLGAALTTVPRPPAAELAALLGPVSDVDSVRCSTATCRLRAQVRDQVRDQDHDQVRDLGSA